MTRETHRGNIWKSGDSWRECDICGFDYYRSELRKNSDGLIVCSKDYEPEHPRKKRDNRVKESGLKEVS